MLGKPGVEGIIPKILDQLLARADGDGGWSSTYTVTFIEVYNEEIKDLLDERGRSGPPGGLELQEDPKRGPCIAGATEVAATSVDAIMELLHRGNARRTQEATGANSESSRSHAVLQIAVETRDARRLSRATASAKAPRGATRERT